MRGIGEIVTLDASFAPRFAVLANPGAVVSTREVFARLVMSEAGTAANDLETPAIGIAPVIADVIGLLAGQAGVSGAGMSGSGATCFALFGAKDHAAKAAAHVTKLHPAWWCRETVLR